MSDWTPMNVAARQCVNDLRGTKHGPKAVAIVERWMETVVAEHRAEADERDSQWMEIVKIFERETQNLGLPLEGAGQTPQTLSAWTDAITGLLKNFGMAQLVVRNRSAVVSSTEGKQGG